MGRSFKLFSVSGIDVRIHFTFPIILLWAAWQFGAMTGSLSGALFGVIAFILLFVLVTLHELGHSFAARRYGIAVQQIVLSPIGGVAQLKRMPDNPWQEFVIAVAGPAVNVIIAVFMTAVAVVFGFSVGDLLAGLGRIEGLALGALFSYVFVYNIFLAAFNLLPAFPMDGGRVLRALLAMRLDYARATRIAANIGRALAVAFGIWGLLNGGFFQILIAIFIYTAASQEARYAEVRSALRQYTVQQVYQPNIMRVDTGYTLQQVANLTLYGGQRDFPVLSGDQLLGWIDGPTLQQALRTRPGYEPVTAVMRRDVQPLLAEDDLFMALLRLQEENQESLPVLSEPGTDGARRFLGVISRSHINTVYQMSQSAPTSAPRAQSA